ncbi:hypothetical protein [Parafrankia elaeagni]|uniref:hypothetical protein n=1 Tax=Parafrankia elaeagni TaxID=222534 RepID=UPI0018A870EA|nr:hypothetical protein [Parafrankia elaeagni]
MALTVLDEHFDQYTMHTAERAKRRRHGLANYRIIRYADLCRRRHKSAYAEVRVMPTLALVSLVRAVSGFLISA